VPHVRPSHETRLRGVLHQQNTAVVGREVGTQVRSQRAPHLGAPPGTSHELRGAGITGHAAPCDHTAPRRDVVRAVDVGNAIGTAAHLANEVGDVQPVHSSGRGGCHGSVELSNAQRGRYGDSRRDAGARHRDRVGDRDAAGHALALLRAGDARRAVLRLGRIAPEAEVCRRAQRIRQADHEAGDASGQCDRVVHQVNAVVFVAPNCDQLVVVVCVPVKDLACEGCGLAIKIRNQDADSARARILNPVSPNAVNRLVLNLREDLFERRHELVGLGPARRGILSPIGLQRFDKLSGFEHRQGRCGAGDANRGGGRGALRRRRHRRQQNQEGGQQDRPELRTTDVLHCETPYSNLGHACSGFNGPACETFL